MCGSVIAHAFKDIINAKQLNVHKNSINHCCVDFIYDLWINLREYFQG